MSTEPYFRVRLEITLALETTLQARTEETAEYIARRLWHLQLGTLRQGGFRLADERIDLVQTEEVRP